MTSSQDGLFISDIQSDLIFLKDGGVSAVIKTSAVNFGLLSEIEQYAIIESFAGLLNSLSFPIQIVIRSERLDVSSYLTNLDKALQIQTNPLMANLIVRYREFVRTMIKDNEVLDKQFYIVIHVIAAELGLLSPSPTDKVKKTAIILGPRLEHLTRQLSRIGLKTTRVITPELVSLFYHSYNETSTEINVPKVAPLSTPISQTSPRVTAPVQVSPPSPLINRPSFQRVEQTQSVINPISAKPPTHLPYQAPIIGSSQPIFRNTPFIVEELKD